MTTLRRDKKAYIAYMSELLLKQKSNPNAILEDNILIEEEIKWVEKHINDIDFVIRLKEIVIEA